MRAGDLAMSTAHAEPARQPLRRQARTALGRGIFGAPTFFVGDETCWGNDRLDKALAAASPAWRRGRAAGG